LPTAPAGTVGKAFPDSPGVLSAKPLPTVTEAVGEAFADSLQVAVGEGDGSRLDGAVSFAD
jgi:hypothetical protein